MRICSSCSLPQPALQCIPNLFFFKALLRSKEENNFSTLNTKNDTKSSKFYSLEHEYFVDYSDFHMSVSGWWFRITYIFKYSFSPFWIILRKILQYLYCHIIILGCRLWMKSWSLCIFVAHVGDSRRGDQLITLTSLLRLEPLEPISGNFPFWVDKEILYSRCQWQDHTWDQLPKMSLILIFWHTLWHSRY